MADWTTQKQVLVNGIFQGGFWRYLLSPPCGDIECVVEYVSNHYNFRNKEIFYQ